MRCFFLTAAFIACVAGLATEDADVKAARKHHSKHHGKHHGKHHHHHHHHGKHHKHDAAAAVNPADVAAFGKSMQAMQAMDSSKPAVKAEPAKATKQAAPVSHVVSKAKTVAPKAKEVKAKAKPSEDAIVKQMKVLEEKLQKKKVEKQGQIFVNGPLPADFKERFAQAVSVALGKPVKVTKTKASEGGIVAISFVGSPHVVDQVTTEVSDPDSKLATGNLHSFLVAKGDDEEEAKPAAKAAAAPESEATPVEEKGIDIDTAMPYGDLEPFGREDTAQELTEDSIKESDGMVDQLERAEVAEEKRAVFRALTRLRGAAITSFDGVARSQTGNIDEYNKIHKWRSSHPLHHLADEESDISKWAFPDNADF